MCDISNNSVNDGNSCKQREGGDNIEEDLPALESVPFNDELEPDTEEYLPEANITIENIIKMHIKYLKEYFIARSFVTIGNKKVLGDPL